MNQAELSPIPRISVVDAAFEELRSRILRGVLAPGERLPTELDLSRALGVSRSTVREALNRLASARLINIQHGGSKTVLDYREHAGLEVVPALVAGSAAGMGPGIVRSVTELRSLIAPDAARMAAQRATQKELEELMDAARGMQLEAASLDELTSACMQFWKTLVLASHNLAYRLAFNSLLVTYVSDSGVLRQTIAEELRASEHYLQIAEAVEAGDADLARDKTTALMDIGSRAIFAAIEFYEEKLETEGQRIWRSESG